MSIQKRMSDDDALSIGMVCLVETLLHAIGERSAGNHKRRYWTERALKCTEGIDKTIQGAFPAEFVGRAEAFYRRVEVEFVELMESRKV